MTKLTERQLSIQHILGTGVDHTSWHSSFPERIDCPFCETLQDLEAYMEGACKQAIKSYEVTKRAPNAAKAREVQRKKNADINAKRLRWLERFKHDSRARI